MLRAVARAAMELAGLEGPADTAVDAWTEASIRSARALGEAAIVDAQPPSQQREMQRLRAAAPLARAPPARAPAFAPPWAVRPRASYASVAVPVFIYPLVHRYWDARHAASRLYAGSEALAAPVLVAALLHTLCVLCYAARYVPAFVRQVVPDLLGVADALGAAADEQVAAAALALVLVLLDAAWEHDRGRALLQACPATLERVQSWAHRWVEHGEGGALAAQGAARASAVLLRLVAMHEDVRERALAWP